MKYFIIFIMSLVVFTITGCDEVSNKSDAIDQTTDPVAQVENMFDLSSEYYPDWMNTPGMVLTPISDDVLVVTNFEDIRIYFFSEKLLSNHRFEIDYVVDHVYNDKTIWSYPWLITRSLSHEIVVEVTPGYDFFFYIEDWIDHMVLDYIDSGQVDE